MKDVEIQKTQFWQTFISIPILIIAAAICVGAFFGGNFRDESLRKTDFWWWFSAGMLALIARRYYKKGTKIVIICAVAISAAVGLIITDYFLGIKLVEWAITLGVIIAMTLLSFLPVLGFFEYKPVPKLIVLYPVFSFIALCFVMIAAFTLTFFIYVALWLIRF